MGNSIIVTFVLAWFAVVTSVVVLGVIVYELSQRLSELQSSMNHRGITVEEQLHELSKLVDDKLTYPYGILQHEYWEGFPFNSPRISYNELFNLILKHLDLQVSAETIEVATPKKVRKLITSNRLTSNRLTKNET